MMKICKVCGKNIPENRHGNAVTCSNSCSEINEINSCKKYAYERKIIHKISCKFIIWIIKDELGCKNGCKDIPHVALDFHHVNDDKYDSIAKLCSLGRMDRLLDELPKCELLCAICHRIKHERGSDLW